MRWFYALVALVLVAVSVSTANGQESEQGNGNLVTVTMTLQQDGDNNGEGIGDTPLSGASVFLTRVPVGQQDAFAVEQRDLPGAELTFDVEPGAYELSIIGPRSLTGEQEDEACHGWRISYVTGAKLANRGSGRPEGDLGPIIEIDPGGGDASTITVGLSSHSDAGEPLVCSRDVGGPVGLPASGDGEGKGSDPPRAFWIAISAICVAIAVGSFPLIRRRAR